MQSFVSLWINKWHSITAWQTCFYMIIIILPVALFGFKLLPIHSKFNLSLNIFNMYKIYGRAISCFKSTSNLFVRLFIPKFIIINMSNFYLIKYWRLTFIMHLNTHNVQFWSSVSFSSLIWHLLFHLFIFHYSFW